MMAQDDALAALALQRSLLPTALPAVPGLDLAARYVTGSGTVGGDWYDVFVLPDGRLGVVVGDVAGSGLEAAVIMGRMRSALRAYALGSADPAAALRLLDRKIQYFEPDAMATVLYGLYTPEPASSPFPQPGTSRRSWRRQARRRPCFTSGRTRRSAQPITRADDPRRPSSRRARSSAASPTGWSSAVTR
jgi:hypothetical protein